VRFGLDDLQREAAATGFSADMLEKASRLLGLLEAIRSHPFLGPRIALKGGTALNLFVLDLPRLSVDIDLNYIGAPSREVMLAERPQVDQAIHAVCGREELGVRRVPDEHAGGKWRLTYTFAAGGPGNLELDMNFLLRTPLWPVKRLDSRPLGSLHACRSSTSMSLPVASSPRCCRAARAVTSSIRVICFAAATSTLRSFDSASSCTALRAGGNGGLSKSTT